MQQALPYLPMQSIEPPSLPSFPQVSHVEPKTITPPTFAHDPSSLFDFGEFAMLPGISDANDVDVVEEEKSKAKKQEEEEEEERERRARRRRRREREEEEAEREERRQRRRDRENDEAQRQKKSELAGWRKHVDKKNVATTKKFSCILGLVSSGVEASAAFLGSEYARMTDLADNVEASIQAGEFDDTIASACSHPVVIAALENPVTGFVSTYSTIMLKTHLDNSKKSIDHGVREFRNGVMMSREERKEFAEWQQWKASRRDKRDDEPAKEAPKKKVSKPWPTSVVREEKVKKETKVDRPMFGSDVDAANTSMVAVRKSMEKMAPVLNGLSKAASLMNSEEKEKEDVDEKDDMTDLLFT
jgi:hypothetical protein